MYPLSLEFIKTAYCSASEKVTHDDINNISDTLISNIAKDLCDLLNHNNKDLFEFEYEYTYSHEHIENKKIKKILENKNVQKINYAELMIEDRILIWNNDIKDLEGLATLLFATVKQIDANNSQLIDPVNQTIDPVNQTIDPVNQTIDPVNKNDINSQLPKTEDKSVGTKKQQNKIVKQLIDKESIDKELLKNTSTYDLITYMNKIYDTKFDTKHDKCNNVKLLFKNILKFLLGYKINRECNIFENIIMEE